MAPSPRRKLMWMATAAATAAARRVSATSRRKSSSLDIKEVESVVDKRLKNLGIGTTQPGAGKGTVDDNWFNMRNAVRTAINVTTSGVVTAMMFAYIEKSNELTKKDVLLFIYQREEAKEKGKEVTPEPDQSTRRFLGLFKY